MNNSICIIEGCEAERYSKSRYCRKHLLERKREQAKARYKINGRHLYDVNCVVCGKRFKGQRPEAKYCKDCWNKINASTSYVKNGYVNGEGKGYCWKHRRIAEELLCRKLSTNEVVHHMDLDEKNNDVKNLIVISRVKHGALHSYLRQQRVILEGSNKENFENCWKNLIVPMTTTWLETANVKAIKLWEIGQSAAEHLNEKSKDEGSETMYEASRPDEDIVQTTTKG
jgi:hypothetical protein